MATSTVGQNASPMRHYYTPSNEIKLAPGVVRHVTDTYTDTYWGTAESLSASGLAPLSVFLGSPGNQLHRSPCVRAALPTTGECQVI